MFIPAILHSRPHQAEHWAGSRRLLIWATQSCVFCASTCGAFLLRFDFTVPEALRADLFWAVLIWLAAKSVVFRLLSLDRGWWRYLSIYDAARLALGNLLGSLLGAGLIFGVAGAGFPRSIYLLDFVLCVLVTAGKRVALRMLMDSLDPAAANGPGTRTFIYGGGAAGVNLLREIRSNPSLGYTACGFIDDNPAKRGVLIQGMKVLGTGADLAVLAAQRRVSQVLIAAPSASGPEMTRILNHCHSSGIRCRTVPALAEIIQSDGLARQVRDVAVEDLLGRQPIRLEEERIRESVEGKVILVTGAAGSIGSELCRQIARFRPAAIVGFEIAESPLFEIDRELRQSFPRVPFYPEIGSIQNRARIEEVLRRRRPSVLYHAAAYKHVPLMEAHVFEAIENNVFGTFNVATAAAAHGVEDFVMISSDKAVRPTNVMGAAKRVAELVLLALQNGSTKYVTVRFGNVLGSSGSVIPIFKKQIAAGGPVTVTHPEMRRFFMTIPEACQLVLQAAAIGEGGQICVLDMGEPVKIIDLARNLILLSGRRPDEDIKISFTGMRPGEKLYEELNTLLEDTVPTTHEKIRIHTGNGMPQADTLAWLESLRDICDERDVGGVVVALKELVLDYSPSAELLKRAMEDRGHHQFSPAATR
jgi:FlaA1/EpsC-like NDP-sugar epimerase